MLAGINFIMPLDSCSEASTTTFTCRTAAPETKSWAAQIGEYGLHGCVYMFIWMAWYRIVGQTGFGGGSSPGGE